MNNRYNYRAWDINHNEMFDVRRINIESCLVQKYKSDLNDNDSYDWLGFEQINLMQCSGVPDDCSVFIYEGDIVEYSIYSGERYVGIVKFGEYEQDGSGGEYGGRKCLGFYINRAKVILEKWEDEEDIEWREREHQETLSIFEPEEIKVLGNIYDNPQLLDGEVNEEI